MEEFLNSTKGFLGVIQSLMKPEEKERSTEAAKDMYEEISKVVKKHDLNILEMTNASIAIQATVLQLALEQMEDRRKKESK
jgi:hypothetical protein